MVEFKVLEINLNVGTSKLMKRKLQLRATFRPQLATLYLVKRAPGLKIRLSQLDECVCDLAYWVA